MKKQTITGSSAVKEIGYDPETKEMEVEFHKTGGYRYYDISQEEFDDIMLVYNQGGSIGVKVREIVQGKDYINLRKELL